MIKLIYSVNYKSHSEISQKGAKIDHLRIRSFELVAYTHIWIMCLSKVEK